MKRKTNYILIYFAALFTLSIFLSSCSDKDIYDNKSESIHYSFTDYSGNTVTLDKAPEKTAVLFSSFAEVWELAGGNVSITVGESIERGFAGSDAIIVDAGAGKTINTELLVASEPDFVICSADIEAQVKAAELLKDAGIPTAVFKVESFNDYLSMLKICTDITGCSELFEKNGTDVERNIKSILESVKNNKFEKNILFIRAGSSDSSTKAKKAGDHFAAAMLEELGAYNIADNAPILLDGLSIEEILCEDPDFIFISTMGNEQAAIEHMDSILQTPAWKSLSAIKNGKYAYLPKELFQFKPNARWDEAYEYLIGLLYD